MIRTATAIAAVGFVLAAAAPAQAAPIAPLSKSAIASSLGNVTEAGWRRCWRDRWGRTRCTWCTRDRWGRVHCR